MRHAIILLLGLLLALPWAGPPAAAQDPADAWTTAGLNVRLGPDAGYAAVALLPPQTALQIEARSPDASWVLGSTLNQRFRGWMAGGYLSFSDSLALDSLPVSDEILPLTAFGAPNGARYRYDESFRVDHSALIRARAAAIDLDAVPVIPAATERARAIYAQGARLGRDPAIVSKIGDCNSSSWLFLHPFGEGRYTLGEYADLQPVIDQYAGAFTLRSMAAENGLNVSAVLDPLWANPAHCQPGESPLACEYRVHNPSLAVIMFGTNDLLVLTPEQFDHALRRVVIETIQAGVVPLLSTFPPHASSPEHSALFNQMVIRVALDHNVPVMNLWRALKPLANHGIGADGFHLHGPITSAGDLTPPNLESGYPVRNLVTLQALDAVWRGVAG
jgi:hypothetical protein